MKRFHLNLTVGDLDRSIAFYSALFNADPTVRHDDYAKWMLDDPRVNFAISTRGTQPGVDHVGLQAQDAEELAEIRARLELADRPIFDQDDVTCCYARSTKAWIRDPDGLAWETFLSHGQTSTYGDGVTESGARTVGAAEARPCCGGDAARQRAACC